MVRRLLHDGHHCVVYDRDTAATAGLQRDGAHAVASLAELAAVLSAPRVVWMMVPAAAVDAVLTELTLHLSAGDIVVDGGNSHYRDDLRRARTLAPRGIRYVDVGTSGGVAGLHRLYLGRIVSGLIWLFTGGLFGFGTVVDLFLLMLSKIRLP